MFSKRMPVAITLCLLPICVSPARIAAQDEPKKPARVRTLDELADRKVTLELKDATLREALEALFKKVPVNRVVMFDTGADTKITFKVDDVPFEGALMCILRAAKRMPLQYESGSNLLIIGPDRNSPAANATNKKVWIDVQGLEVKYVLQAILKGIHADYSCDASVSGQISLVVTGEPFDVALKRLCANKVAPLTWTQEDRLYKFSSAK
jgi:hypothetical protein